MITRRFHLLIGTACIASLAVALLMLQPSPSSASSSAAVRLQLGQAITSNLGAAVTGARQPSTIDFIDVEGVIDPALGNFITRRIESAERGRSAAVVMTLDTPGGLNVSVRRIVQRILDSQVPVIVWIPHRASVSSTGTFIAYAAHVVAVAPGSTIRSPFPASLVPGSFGGRRSEVSAEGAKDVARAFFKSVAGQRGRSTAWIGDVEGSDGLGAREAVSKGAADFTAGSPASLLEGLRGRQIRLGDRAVAVDAGSTPLRFHRLGMLGRLLHVSTNPNVAYIFLLFGLFGLIFELYHPGMGLAGGVGGGLLALATYGLSTLPTSWGSVALILLGILMLTFDLHRANLAVATIAGFACLLAGSLRLLAGASEALDLSPFIVALGLTATALFFFSIMTAAIRVRTRPPAFGVEEMLGVRGEATTEIAPEGEVRAGGTLWRARTIGRDIEAGAPIRVCSVSGLILEVEGLSDGDGQGPSKGPGVGPSGLDI